MELEPLQTLAGMDRPQLQEAMKSGAAPSEELLTRALQAMQVLDASSEVEDPEVLAALDALSLHHKSAEHRKETQERGTGGDGFHQQE